MCVYIYICMTINSKYVLYTQTKTVIVDNGETHPPVWVVNHENTTVTVTLTMQYLIMTYKKGLTPRWTGWLTASHNVTDSDSDMKQCGTSQLRK